MKILILVQGWPTIDSPLDGIFYKTQVEALVKKGMKIEVIVLKTTSIINVFNKNKNLVLYLNGYTIHVITKVNFFPKIKKSNILFYQFYHACKKFISKNLDIEKFDIIHAHNLIWMGLITSKLSKDLKLTKIPVIVTEHSTDFLSGKISKKNTLLIKRLSENIDVLLPVGFGLKKIMMNITKTKNVHQLDNMIDTNKFYTNRNHKKLFKFISIGSLEYKKGFDSLLKAFNKLEHENVNLTLIGDGPSRSELEQLIVELNLQTKVELKGAINPNEIPKLLANSNAFVLTSRYETFGVVYIEALASGLPIIATKTGGPDHFVNDENGILVEIDDIEQIKNALNQIIQNYNLYNPEEIREYAKKFDIDSISLKLLKIYSKAIIEKN